MVVPDIPRGIPMFMD